MIKLTGMGIILMLILATLGGYITGMFAGYLYDLARQKFSRKLSIALNLIFYIVPVWAIISITKQDGLLWFYMLLLVFYYLGLRFSSQQAALNKRPDHNYEIDD